MKSIARQHALVRASEIVGGFDRLAERLGVSRLTVRAMLGGKIDIPQRLFFEMIDIIAMQSPVDDALPPGRRESTTESGRSD